jgi:glycine cleavage system aminomethyltransferase T
MTARLSPLEPLWRAKASVLQSQFGMPVPATFEREDERARLDRVGIADVSGWPRATVKGPSCAEVVARHGFQVLDAWFEPAFEPARKGAWSFAARTGRTEFFVEGWPGDPATKAPAYVREDASMLLAGPALPDLLAEVLTLPLDLALPRLGMIQIARVSCVVMPRPGAVPALQLWVDPTYAVYLGDALLSLGEELGGGFMGSAICEREGLLPAGTSTEAKRREP